ncbi:zinc ribbon domain-containing protein [Mediterraneibacter glycyrrhizinilyticus]|uniref:zinc ribbon domain-containing protein n=1 Tax=Mediterraneibacter glycyrrhizinilyticus TaxID=342942 RepID=UPI0025A3F02E|nr:zinc ribbon domain-containing protein [Mediterraneibacter glycyrrhizinilyticus]MDM8209750.1 zinc ribbon domain-containing protein [Mediterraneibacter glycyrrhizinilyticus]
MFCRFCGKELPEGARFCNNCGRIADVMPLQQAARRRPMAWFKFIISSYLPMPRAI